MSWVRNPLAAPNSPPPVLLPTVGFAPSQPERPRLEPDPDRCRALPNPEHLLPRSPRPLLRRACSPGPPDGRIPTWKPGFYPQDLAQRHFLTYYAAHLSSVEVNYTFRALSHTRDAGQLAGRNAGVHFASRSKRHSASRTSPGSRMRRRSLPPSSARSLPCARRDALGYCCFSCRPTSPPTRTASPGFSPNPRSAPPKPRRSPLSFVTPPGSRPPSGRSSRTQTPPCRSPSRMTSKPRDPHRRDPHRVPPAQRRRLHAGRARGICRYDRATCGHARHLRLLQA